MFSPHTNKAVGFESSWRTEQKLTFSSTQTEEISSKDSECQVLETRESSAQTEEEAPPAVGNSDVNEHTLLDFLRRISPQVMEELQKQERSSAFDGFSLVDDERTSGAALLHALRWPDLFPQGSVSCVSWSSTGSVVAVAYGADTHDTWCQHKSAVALWNINRTSPVSVTPERLLEVSSCVPCVAFHPHTPALLALATRTGEVQVYDTSDSERVTPVATCYTGGSGVTCLTWRADNSLAAATEGGHVFLCTLSMAKESLTIDAGFLIGVSDLPRGRRVAVGDGGLGITCLSFNSEDASVFVAAVEGGALVLCSTTQQMPSTVSVEGVQLRRCVVSVLSGHSGRVVSVDCSPHHRNLLLSVASDQQLKLHSLIRSHEAAVTFHSDDALTAARWSPQRPVLLAAATHAGQVLFYDACQLQRSEGVGDTGTAAANKEAAPLLTLPPPEKTAPITAIAFNAANGEVFAAGDALARVRVWRLPTDVVSPHTSDATRLASLLVSEHDD